jgi:hypothetical protein
MNLSRNPRILLSVGVIESAIGQACMKVDYSSLSNTPNSVQRVDGNTLDASRI